MQKANLKQLVMVGAAMAAATTFGDTLGTYYLSQGDGDDQSCWLSDWAYRWRLGSTSGEKATAVPNADYDYVTLGPQMRPPESTSTTYKDVTFDGHSLTLNGGSILVRNKGADQKITFANEGVIVQNGMIGSWNECNLDLYGKISVPGYLRIFESSARDKYWYFHDKISGSGSIYAHTLLNTGDQHGTNFIATFGDGVLDAFTGTITTYWRQSYGKSRNANYTSTICLKGGDFPGTLNIYEGSNLKVDVASSVNNLAMKDETYLNLTGATLDETSPLYTVKNTATLGSHIYMKYNFAGETLDKIYTAIGNNGGSYSPAFQGGIALRVPNAVDLAGTTFGVEGIDPTSMSYTNYVAGTDLVIVPQYTRYVYNSGSTDNYSDNAFNTASRWSDGKVPTDKKSAYVVSGRTMRTAVYGAGTTSVKNTFKGGALIIKSNTIILEQGSALVVDDLRVMGGTLTVRAMNGKGWVTKFWDYDVYVRKTDGTVYGSGSTTNFLTRCVPIEGNCGIASGAALTLGPYSLQTALELMANTYGSGNINFSFTPQNQFEYGSPVYRISGNNTNFVGRFIVEAASCINKPYDHQHVYFTSRAAFGGDRSSYLYNQFLFNKNAILHIPTNTAITVDQKNLAFYFGGNASVGSASCGYIGLDVASNSVFTLKEQLTFNNAVKKTGLGTLALGYSAPKFGTSSSAMPTNAADIAALRGTNVLHIAEGTFKAVTTNAINGLEMVFSEGTAIEAEAAEDITTGIGKFGMVNTLWDTPFVLPEGGITVKLTDPNNYLAKQLAGQRKIAIATVKSDKAATLADKINLDSSAISDGFKRITLETTENADGTTTFFANIKRGGTMLICR